MPPPQTAIVILARAITKLEAAPMPARLNAASRQLFASIAPEADFGQRIVFANL